MPRSRLTTKASTSTAIPQLGSALEFLTLLWDLDHELEAQSSRMRAAFGITAQQRMLVRILGRFPELPAGQLADMLRIHPGTLSTALNRLERRGLVARRRSKDDRRRVTVALTAKGRRLDVPTRNTVESAVGHVLDQVSARDVAVVGRFLRALSEALRTEAATTSKPRKQPRRNAG